MSTPLHAVDPSPPEARRPVEPPTQEEAFPLLDYLQLLWFRRRVIILITLLVGVLGWLHVNQLQSIYTARSTLLIGVTERPVDLNQVLYQRYFGLEAPEEVEVLRSRGLAEKVITRLGLLNRAEFNPSLRQPEAGLFDWVGNLNPLTWIPDSTDTSSKVPSPLLRYRYE